MDADVAVIGLGTMGSMTIWQLARKGISVLGFEQFGIGHDRSAYGGGSRRFRIASPLVEESLFIKESYPIFRELERETGQHFLSNSGSLTIGDPNSTRMKNVIKSAENNNLSYKILDTTEAKYHYPQHRLLPEEFIVWDQLGGVIRPEQTVISAVNRAQSLGAKILSYSKVENIQADSKGVSIETNNRTYRVGKVIVTAGAWANKLVPSLDKVFSVYRLIMSWFIPKNPEEFSEDNFPNFSRLSDGVSMQGTPALDGRMVRVTNSSETLSEAKQKVDNPDSFKKDVSLEYVVSVRESIARLIPNLNPEPVRISTYIDGFTSDGFPIVGSLQESDNIILVCGFSAQGFSQAPAMGKIATDFVLKGRTNYQIDHLSPNRFDVSTVRS